MSYRILTSNSNNNVTTTTVAFVLGAVVAVASVVLFFGAHNKKKTKKNMKPTCCVFKSLQDEEKILALYDEKLSQWPTTPYESKYVTTERYGTIHVIISGPKDGRPMILIPACGLGAWSWITNVGTWNEAGYRTYAIDNVGEGNKNVLKERGVIPQTGLEIAELYEDLIVNHFGVSQPVIVAGASIGGYVATQLAIHKAKLVDKLVLFCSSVHITRRRT